jgi:UDP-N-acetylmuramoyl-tripeptide--D-alanyl-D-alanine ligase
MSVAADNPAGLWTSAEIAAATGGTASADFIVSGVTFDSREVQPGDLFIAMRGEDTDGHRFIDAALAAGAAGIVCETAIDGPHVRVADGFAALTALGHAARARTAATVFGVTGSVGKTGTKEALAAALDRWQPGCVHRSVKSYNNHTGVPLSLARMPRNASFGVFEMGMNHAGEIAGLTAMVRPHVAIITAVAPAHIENLGSIEAIARAKAEVFEGLEPDGVAIIPQDSLQIDILARAASAHAAHVVRFGTSAGASVRALDWVMGHDTGGSIVTAQVHDTTLCFGLAPPGDHWVSNAMAVLAAVAAVDGDLSAAGIALAALPGLAGRGQRHRIAAGDGDALLIDESYNANPASMAATLAILAREPAQRRVAVLGAMKELGVHGPALHSALAEPILAAGVERLWLVGEEMGDLAKALVGRTELTHGASVDAVIAGVCADVRPGDAILVKGSNSVGLSRLVSSLAVAALAGGGA